MRQSIKTCAWPFTNSNIASSSLRIFTGLRSIITLLLLNRGSSDTILIALSSPVTNRMGAVGSVVRISTAASIPFFAPGSR